MPESGVCIIFLELDKNDDFVFYVFELYDLMIWITYFWFGWIGIDPMEGWNNVGD